MKKLVVNNGIATYVDLTAGEVEQIQEEELLNDFEQSLQLSTNEVEQADFEIKIITLLIELGVIS